MSSIVPGDFFQQIPGAIEVERAAIAQIVRAVRHGDADRAARDYEQMMNKLAESVASVLRDRGLFELTEAAPADGAASA